jgi:hypothetical protein
MLREWIRGFLITPLALMALAQALEADLTDMRLVG